MLVSTSMKTIWNRVKENKGWAIAGFVLFAIILIIIIKPKNTGATEYTVARADVVNSVLLSGKALTEDRADLGFAASGRLGSINVKNNQKVFRGQIIAQLEIADLLADRRIKAGSLESSNIEITEAHDNVEKVTREQDTLVASAYRTLLSEDLTAVPDSSTYDLEAPEITGAYSGVEGEYKLIIDKESPNDDFYTLKTFKLEEAKTEIEKDEPTAIGTRGLFVSFPENISEYNNTTWYVSIPNKKSSSYLANVNAYEQAKNTRESAIQKAKFDEQKVVAKQSGGNSSAYAELAKIDAEIAKNSIRAPFDGIVTSIDKSVGESIATNEIFASVLGEGKLEVVLDVPELDVSKLTPGKTLTVAIDAFPGEEFPGTITSINSRDSQIDGVSVYEAFVELAPEPRIKSGMSAYATIEIGRATDVIAVPAHTIEKVDGKDTVTVKLEKGTEARVVTTGIVGSDKMTEILSGLNAGEIVLDTPTK